jgi:hypothetical protein
MGFFHSPRFIVRANGPTKCGRYLLASSLAAALLDGLSEQPAGHSASVSDLGRGVISGFIILFANKLLAWNAISEVAVIDHFPGFLQIIKQRRAGWDIQLQHLFARELL